MNSCRLVAASKSAWTFVISTRLLSLRAARRLLYSRSSRAVLAYRGGSRCALHNRRRNDPLAKRDFIEPKDLLDKPLMASRQAMVADLPKWFGDDIAKLNLIVGLDLSYNGSVLAKEGTGYLLTFDGLVDTSRTSRLCFRPLMPELTTNMYIIWRRGQQFTRAGELFLDTLRHVLGE